MAALHAAAALDGVRIDAGWRCIVTGFLALTLFPAHPVESWQGLAFPGNNWIDGWVRWDSFWYESIVDPHPRFVPAILERELLSVLFVGVVDRGATVPRVSRSRARVLHWRADRVVGVVPARTQGGRSIDDEAGGRRRGGADDLADRPVSVNGGTLFLDEVGDMPLPLQAKLFVLDNGEVSRIGSNDTIKVNMHWSRRRTATWRR